MENPFKALKRASVPLVGWETPNPQNTISSILKNIPDNFSALSWDAVQGLVGINQVGVALLQQLEKEQKFDRSNSLNPTNCLEFFGATKLQNLVVFFHQFQVLLENENCIQGIWNLRDKWKKSSCFLIGLAPSIKLPDYLRFDIMIIQESLPNSEERQIIIKQLLTDSQMQDSQENIERYADILSGLSDFSVEQSFAYSIRKDGVDELQLRNTRKAVIESTPGLQIWRGSESFDEIGGLSNLKGYLQNILTSKKYPIRSIGFIDEIEKLFAGSDTDTSGVSQYCLKAFLSAMQDYSIPGIVLVGPPGTGKSMIAKASGKVANCEVISFDTGAMKDSLVGNSEKRIAEAMKIFIQISQGKGLFMATCNKIVSLPPELRRRFCLGTFYLDLPTPEEQVPIWKLWISKFQLAEQPLPDHFEWTGAEIRACCEIADRTGLSLMQAAKFIVPVKISGAKQIEDLRKLADGAFISANAEGMYRRNKLAEAFSLEEKSIGRKINVDN